MATRARTFFSIPLILLGGCNLSVGDVKLADVVKGEATVNADIDTKVDVGGQQSDGGTTVVNNDNSTTINNTTNNNTTIVVVADAVIFADGTFTGARDASHSIVPKAITVDLKTRQLVIAGPSSDGVKGAWLYEQATGSQQVQATGKKSGKFKKLDLQVDDSIDSGTLFQKVNSTTEKGFLKKIDVLMDPNAPRASSSLIVRGFDGADRRLVFPAGFLDRIISGLERVTYDTFLSLVAVSDDDPPIAVMVRTASGTGTEPIYYTDVVELMTIPGRNWEQSKAAIFGEKITDIVYASGAFQFRTAKDNVYSRTKAEILAARL